MSCCRRAQRPQINTRRRFPRNPKGFLDECQALLVGEQLGSPAGGSEQRRDRSVGQIVVRAGLEGVEVMAGDDRSELDDIEVFEAACHANVALLAVCPRQPAVGHLTDDGLNELELTPLRGPGVVVLSEDLGTHETSQDLLDLLLGSI